MKIAYALMGEGRGHVARLIAVAPYLDAELMIFAGGDAYHFIQSFSPIRSQYELIEIPTLKYTYGNGKIKFTRSFTNNMKLVLDFKTYLHLEYLYGFKSHKTTRFIEQKVRDFQPDMIVSDAEFFIQHIRREVPLVSFDRYGKIAFCQSRVHASLEHRLQRHINNFVHKSMMGPVDHIVTTSFYDAPPKKKYRNQVQSMGPIIRQEIQNLTPEEGEHVVVYATHQYIYTPGFIRELKKLKRPVFVYGSQREGRDGNIEYCDINLHSFVEHVAGCAYLISTPGNMLLSEMGYLGKKVAMLWTNPLEQRETALYGQLMGIGRIIHPERMTAKRIESAMEGLTGQRRVRDCTKEIAAAIKSCL